MLSKKWIHFLIIYSHVCEISLWNESINSHIHFAFKSCCRSRHWKAWSIFSHFARRETLKFEPVRNHLLFLWTERLQYNRQDKTFLLSMFYYLPRSTRNIVTMAPPPPRLSKTSALNSDKDSGGIGKTNIGIQLESVHVDSTQRTAKNTFIQCKNIPFGH